MFNTEVEERDRCKANCVYVSNLDIEQLRREDLGREVSFEQQIELITSYIHFFRKLAMCDFMAMPLVFIKYISSHVSAAKDVILKIQNLSIAVNPHIMDARVQILRELSENFKNAVEQVGCCISSFTNATGKDEEQVASSLIDSIRHMKDDMEKQQVELNQILQSARQASGQIGVASHALHFKEAAEEYLKASKNWLYAVIGAVVLIIGWGTACFFIHPTTGDASLIIQFTIAKVIIISGLYYALTTCVKNYKAHRHNYVVNRHKQHSLSSFDTFVKGAGEDIATKNAILLNATQSIFSAQPSGYSNVEPENDTNKIIEILQSPLHK
jgi:hypothetical protein